MKIQNIDGRLGKGDFMWASRSRVHGEWKTCSVRNGHEQSTGRSSTEFSGRIQCQPCADTAEQVAFDFPCMRYYCCNILAEQRHAA